MTLGGQQKQQQQQQQSQQRLRCFVHIGERSSTESGGTGEGDAVVNSDPQEGLGMAVNRSSAVRRRGASPQQYGISSRGLRGAALWPAHDTPWSLGSKSKVDCGYTNVDYVVECGQRSGVSRVRDRREFNDACSSVCQLLGGGVNIPYICLLYTSPSPRDLSTSRMPSSA